MRNLIVAWTALLAFVIVIVLQSFNFDLAQIQAFLQAFSTTQQLSVAGIALVILWVVLGMAWQAARISRVSKTSFEIQQRLDGLLQLLLPTGETQRGLDAATGHLKSNDPEEAIASLQRRLTDAESGTATQQGKNNAADLQGRLQDIRQRQQKLKEQLGLVSNQRREIEPVLNELKERQRQAESSLSELEFDDSRTSLVSRLEETEKSAIKSENRLETLQKAFEAFKRLKTNLSNFQSDLVPLQSTITGVVALADETQELVSKLSNALEKPEFDKLPTRIDELSKGKKEAEHKIELLAESQQTLETLRREMAATKERHDHIERSIADVEQNPAGERLSDSIRKLADLATQTRARLWSLQESLVALGGFKTDLEKMHAEIAPLKEPEKGVHDMDSQVYSLLNRLMTAVSELERSGDVSISSRLEAFSEGKTEAKARIEKLHECFGELSNMRSDIDTLFETMNTSLKKHS